MKVLISGHRLFKLENYDTHWIKSAIEDILLELLETNHIRGLSGMASGVDLWFCDACELLGIRYEACIPFEGQEDTMDDDSKADRQHHIAFASKVHYIKNSAMLEMADFGIIVFDGNKGGTHNVFQQLIEKKKDFIWINPVAKVVWRCFI